MKISTTPVRNWLFRHALLLIVVVVGIAASAIYLTCSVGVLGPAHGLTPEWFAASVMVASGRGFVAPVCTPGAPVTEFLEQKRLALRKSDLADVATEIPWNFHQRYRWLFEAVGLTWRLFGISWQNLKILCVLAFAATAGIVYGLFRLAMNRWLSALGVLLYMASPLLIAELPSVRDFCKVPFILGALLIMGRLVKKTPARGRLLVLSALLGLVIGFGLGFRDDILICLPPAVLTVAFGVKRASHIRCRDKAAAVALLLVCFAVPAAPVLKSAQDIGSVSYHHLIVGLATGCNTLLGMGGASYERLALRDDNLAHAVRASYYRRVINAGESIGFEDRGAATAGKHYLWATAKTYPADLLARAYAAVLYHLGHAPEPFIGTAVADDPVKSALVRLQYPMALHFQRFGAFYATAGLVLLSLADVRTAWLVLLFVLYFCGYTSLQFMTRHVFHLAFVPFWFLGLLVEMAIRSTARLAHPLSRSRTRRLMASPTFWWRGPLRRAALFVLPALLMLWAPLTLGRVYQGRVVHKAIVEKCVAAPLEPLELDPPIEGSEGWTAFRLKTPFPELPFIHQGTDTQQHWNVRTEYLVVELIGTAPQRPMRIEYEAASGGQAFSCTVAIRFADADGKSIIRYFFPVYEFPSYAAVGRTQFLGVAFPRESAGEFLGLYRVAGLESFSLLPHLALPSDRALLRYYETIRP